MKPITKTKIIEISARLPLERLEVIRAGLIYLHLERNDWCRSKTAKSSGFAIKTVRAWVKRLVEMGFVDKLPAPKPGRPKRKKPKKYQERVFVSYEQV